MLKIENNYLRDKTKETLNNKLVNQKKGGMLTGGSWGECLQKSNAS